MVSTLEKRLMLQTLQSKCASPKACRLCHGPLTSPDPFAPIVRATTADGPVDCHPTCLPFACAGCVEKGRGNYGLVDLNNPTFDCHCALCVDDAMNGEGSGWDGRVTMSVRA